MSVVLCLPAHLRVSTAAPRAQAPHGNASLSEATWEPISAFIQPDGSINPIFRSYLLENKERHMLTRAETLSQRKKRN